MKTYLIKLRCILPTFLIVTLGTVAGIAFIRWLFSIRFSILDIKEEVWTLWIPLIFPWIPTTLWLRQRFRILIFKGNKGPFFFQIISWGVMAAMLFISQDYLTTATGKLEVLSNIKEIDKKEKVRYYKLTNFSVAPYYGGSYTDFRTSGKYNQYLNFNIYFVVPILSDTAEKIIDIPKYWYGVKYQKQISNKITDEEKEKKYQVFYSDCIQKMNNYDFHSLDHFERKPTSDDKQHFLKAIESRTKQAPNESFIVL